jgi:hypothetical protein
MVKNNVLGLLFCIAVGCASLAFADDGPTPPFTITRQFNSGGTIHMDLSAGDYSIQPAAEERIHVTGTCRDLNQQARMHADIRVTGGDAKVVTGGPHNNSHFTIEVPRHSNLVIRLSAGSLEIGRIDGDLDVSSHAGDVNIEVGHATEYRSVDASVSAGDVNAPAFGESKGGLFRSIHWSGRGTHRIEAHVGAGDLNLQSAD